MNPVSWACRHGAREGARLVGGGGGALPGGAGPARARLEGRRGARGLARRARIHQPRAEALHPPVHRRAARAAQGALKPQTLKLQPRATCARSPATRRSTQSACASPGSACRARRSETLCPKSLVMSLVRALTSHAQKQCIHLSGSTSRLNERAHSYRAPGRWRRAGRATRCRASRWTPPYQPSWASALACETLKLTLVLPWAGGGERGGLHAVGQAAGPHHINPLGLRPLLVKP